MNQTPTTSVAQDFQQAFDYFNEHMFGGELPPCMILLQRKAKAYGYFWAKRWGESEGTPGTDEISINPSHMYRPDKETISTLVHEQAHCWQEHFGEPSRKGYHNKEWANKMEEIGLMPSSTGTEGGKRTGQKVSHYIITGGLYEQLWTVLEEQGFKINWKEVNATGLNGKGPAKPKTRFKYSCECEEAVNFWAKPGVQAVCAVCDKPFVSEDSDE